jgi:drug/metabolite transporter (DMT)-like permease
LETTTGALLIAVPLFLLNWALLDGELPTELEPRTTLSIVYLAVFGSALGFILQHHVLRHVEASRVARSPSPTRAWAGRPWRCRFA